MHVFTRQLAAVALVLALAACSTTTRLSSTHPDTTVVVKGETVAAPTDHAVMSTSFGNYEFKATSPASDKPFYGLLPLQFKGGRLAMDILFFAPAAFANLRAAYDFYEFDMDNQVIRYKRKPTDSWREYRPTPEEADRARRYYEDVAAGSGGVGAANK